MFRYLPIIAVLGFVLTVVLVIFRINHWPINETVSWAAWIMLAFVQLTMVYYTWQATFLSTASRVLWTIGILAVPVLLIPWWFLRVYPGLKRKIS